MSYKVCIHFAELPMLPMCRFYVVLRVVDSIYEKLMSFLHDDRALDSEISQRKELK